MRPVVWSVGYLHTAGLAGLASDQRAMEALRAHVCTVVTSVRGPGGDILRTASPEMLENQLASLLPDLLPAAIKVGPLVSAENGRLLARWVRRLREQRPVAVVLEPCGPAGEGAAVADAGWRRVLREELLPLATVCVLTRGEAAWLLGENSLDSDSALLHAIPALQSLGACSWLVTQGRRARDLLLSPQFQGWLVAPSVETANDQGRGESLVAALTAALAQGFCEADAAVLAKMALGQGLEAAESAGNGPGPVRVEAGFARRSEHLPVAQRLRPARGVAVADPGPGFSPADDLGLCAVVDSAGWVERLARCGVRSFQLRIRRRVDAALQTEARTALAHARAAGARLYLNQHWRLAIEIGADGLHLDPDDLDSDVDLAALAAAGLGLGLSARSLWELARVAPLRPSYVAFGPVHAGRLPLAPWRAQGVHNLAYACGLLGLPVVAIGGLTTERVRQAARCGIAGFGVGAGITSSFDPEAEVEALQRAWSEGRRLVPHSMPELPQPSLMRPD